MIETNVTINLKPLLRFKSEVTSALREAGASGPIADALTQWGFIFRSFTQRRFDTYSKGGGDWPPLKQSTKEARARAPLGRLSRLYGAGHITQSEYETRRSRALKEVKKRIARIRKNEDRTTILRDTGTLFNALTPSLSGIPGQYQETIPYGIRVGFGGPSRYPTKGAPTIADIASFHQTGGPKLPRREIIVMPPDEVIQRFVEVMDKAFERLLKETHNAD